MVGAVRAQKATERERREEARHMACKNETREEKVMQIHTPETCRGTAQATRKEGHSHRHACPEKTGRQHRIQKYIQAHGA